MTQKGLIRRLTKQPTKPFSSMIFFPRNKKETNTLVAAIPNELYLLRGRGRKNTSVFWTQDVDICVKAI